MVIMNFNVVINGKSYQVEVENLQTTPIVAVVDGVRYDVYPEETQPASSFAQTSVNAPAVQAAALARKAAAPSTGAEVLTAPLPGTIVSIEVKPGDAVKQGQTLCVLEAMKMKNAIKAAADAVVADVHVNQGDLVKHGQALISFKA